SSFEKNNSPHFKGESSPAHATANGREPVLRSITTHFESEHGDLQKRAFWGRGWCSCTSFNERLSQEILHFNASFTPNPSSSIHCASKEKRGRKKKRRLATS
ncbi:hypothetical protein MUK42_37371, partial [Musa troglodytarum]